MKKIGDITNTADKNGEFTDGNVAAGTPPTQLMGAWFNSVQREMLNVLAKAGVPQSATKEDQLAEAITKIVDGAGYLPTGYSYSKIESDGRYQPKGNYQPSGDYATNAALNNGLALKFDKTGGTITGAAEILRLKKSLNSNIGLYIRFVDATGGNMSYMGFGGNSNTLSIANQLTSKELSLHADGRLKYDGQNVMTQGDFGLGSTTGLPADKTAAGNYNTSVGLYSVHRDENIPLPGLVGGYGLMQCPSPNPAYRCQLGFSDTGSPAGSLFIRRFGGADTSDWAKFYHDKNTVVDRNGQLKVTGSAELSDYPVGAPIPWPQATAPSGYLICNGQEFNKATYPLLAQVYPSGVLPDLRAEFLRGLDAGRGVDIGRLVGSSQAQSVESHQHQVSFLKDGKQEEGFNGNYITGQSPNNGSIATSNYGDKETRPRNIAFLYIVRAA